ncbi:hypothetical protein C8Q76DRAFT_789153 [Earliella scabrosa]|nr:hypothetical protein C8Q76DRAFT_789153 [Earliella scabrosa]
MATVKEWTAKFTAIAAQTVEASKFHPFKGKAKKQVAGTSTDQQPETCTCFKHGKPGHIARKCKAKKISAAQFEQMEAKLKQLQKQLASVKAAEKMEDF